MEIIRGKVVENGWRYLFIRLLSYRQRYFIYIYFSIFFSSLFNPASVRLWLWTVITQRAWNFSSLLKYTISRAVCEILPLLTQYHWDLYIYFIFLICTKRRIIWRNFVLDFRNVHMYKRTQWIYAEII